MNSVLNLFSGKKFLSGIFLCFINFANAQLYEQIYEVSSLDVRAKIDENKISGISILDDILVSYSVVFVEGTNDLDSLIEQIVKNESKFIDLSFNESTHIYVIRAVPTFNEVELKNVFLTFDIIPRVISKHYEVKK